MLGYVTIEKSELKIREYDVYQAYYCGICKSIGERLGQIPRMALSYDGAFLALLLSGLSEEADDIKEEHCIVHHIQKRPTARNSKAVDYAADVMTVLAYHKFLDDWNDDRSCKGFVGKTALQRAYSKLSKTYGSLCSKTESALERLSFLEREKSGKIDEVTAAFADIMEEIFTGYMTECNQRRILGQMGRSLGKWIYLIDALDDYGEDRKRENYNPLIYRQNKLEGMDDLIYNYLADISIAYDLLDIKKHEGILNNIIFMGLRRRTDVILKEREQNNEQSI